MFQSFWSIARKLVQSWKRRGLGTRLLMLCALLLAIILLLFAVSNLCLNSSLFRDQISQKLKQRTGLECAIDSMVWSPWNGVTVSGVSIEPPIFDAEEDEALITIKRVRVTPYWRSLFNGKLEVKRVRLLAPHANISLETLEFLASQYNPEIIPEPLIASNPVTQNKAGKTPDQPAVVARKTDATPAKKPEAKVNRKVAKKVVPVVPKRPKAALPMNFSIDGASVRIFSAEKKMQLIEVSDVSVDTSIFGEDSEGLVKVGLLKMIGLADVEKIEQQVTWERPYLDFKNDKVNFLGLAGGMHARFILNKANIRQSAFQGKLVFKPQKLDVMHELEWMALLPDADRVYAEMNFGGYALAPMSWRGSFIARAENVHVIEQHGEHQLQFDEVFIPAYLSNGRLKWDNLRCISEEFSVLGNGELTMDGQLAAVTRLVACPEYAYFVRRVLMGSMITRGHNGWWRNLDTPDMKVRDILAIGSIKNPMLDVGHNHGQMEASQVYQLLMNFIKREMGEEGKRLPSPPNGERLTKEGGESMIENVTEKNL